MTAMIQVLANGVVQGALYALLGVSFALVFHPVRSFHIALGGIYAAAPFVLLAALGAGLPLWLGIPLALGVCGLLGLACEETIHWPLQRKAAPPAVHLLASLGLFLVFEQVIVLIWGNDSRVFSTARTAVFDFGVIRLAATQLVGLLVSVGALVGFFAWLYRSGYGLQLRALADDPALLSLTGRNVRRLRRVLFVASGIMAGTVAILIGYDVGLDPHVGLHAVLVGAVAAIVGGDKSFVGTAMAGLMLGLIRGQVVWWSSARWEDAATFAILAFFLLFRPQGMIASRLRTEEPAG